MNILVTGGAGYIGSHACKALSRAGHTPIALDNLSMGHASACKWGPLEQGDLADQAFVKSVFQKHKPAAVMHFAASAFVGESMTDPRKYFRNNYVNTLNLLETMLDHGVDKLVFSSTCATYGVPKVSPMDETLPQSPVNPYGEAKYFVERTLHWFAQAYGLKWIALRYFNAAGGDPEGEIGEDHTPETHLIPVVMEATLGRRPHVEVMGTDYPTPDGTAVRDYIHVNDLADAHIKALNYLSAGGAQVALNLGTGKGHSVKEIIASVERVSGKKVPVKASPRRAGDPPALVANAAKAHATLNWTPVSSDIDTIVAHAWKWFSNKK